MQSVTIRRPKEAFPSQPARRYDTSDSECSTYLRASLVSHNSREDYGKQSGNLTSQSFQDSYQDPFSDNERSLNTDWLDEQRLHDALIQSTNRDRVGELQEQISRFACSGKQELQGYQRRCQSHPKHVLVDDKYIRDDGSYGKYRDRENQGHAPRRRQLLVDEKDLLDRNKRMLEEICRQMVEDDTRYPTVRTTVATPRTQQVLQRHRSAGHSEMTNPTFNRSFPQYRDQSAGDRRQHSSRNREPETRATRPPPPRAVPQQPAASHPRARPLNGALTHIASHSAPSRPIRAAGTPAAPCADQALLRQAFAAAVGERRIQARSWRLERAMDGEI
jgi:hypothetical protein